MVYCISPCVKFVSPCFFAPPTMLAKWTGSGPHSASWNADEAAAALDERVERGAILHGHVAGIAFVDDDHVDAFELGGRREVQRAVDDGAALGQQLAPVGEELRVVVKPGTVRLQAGADVDLEAHWDSPRSAHR